MGYWQDDDGDTGRVPLWQALIFVVLLVAYLWVLSTGVINCPR